MVEPDDVMIVIVVVFAMILKRRKSVFPRKQGGILIQSGHRFRSTRKLRRIIGQFGFASSLVLAALHFTTHYYWSMGRSLGRSVSLSVSETDVNGFALSMSLI